MSDNTKQLTIYEGKTVHGIVRRNNDSKFLVNRIDIFRNQPTPTTAADIVVITHATDHTKSYMQLCSKNAEGVPYEANIRIYTQDPCGAHEDTNMPVSYSLESFFANYTSTSEIMKETQELHIVIAVPNEATLADLEEIYSFNIGCMRSDQINDNTQLSSRGTPVSPSMRTVSATLVIRGWDMTLDFHID